VGPVPRDGVRRLDSGGVFASPSGITISGDGKQLFVADPAADDDTTDQYGGVFVLPAGGGTPGLLAGTGGLQPRGVVAAGSTLYFTAGAASASGPGVYSIALAGGQPAAWTALANIGSVPMRMPTTRTVQQPTSFASVQSGPREHSFMVRSAALS